MLKKILIGLGSVGAVLAIAAFIFTKITKSKSPAVVAETNANGFSAKVEYCQPAKKGRIIFGALTSVQKALCPYGEVWRTGANEATLITFGQDVMIAGKPLKKGTYSLWTVPDPATWTVVFNSETGQWGTQYDRAKDALRVDVPTGTNAKEEELLKISFKDQPDGADMILEWDTTQIVVPIKK
jgi:hypothetical protein